MGIIVHRPVLRGQSRLSISPCLVCLFMQSTSLQAVYVSDSHCAFSNCNSYRQEATAFGHPWLFCCPAAVYLYHHYTVQDGFGPRTFLQTTAGAALARLSPVLARFIWWYVLLRTQRVGGSLLSYPPQTRVLGQYGKASCIDHHLYRWRYGLGYGGFVVVALLRQLCWLGCLSPVSCGRVSSIVPQKQPIILPKSMAINAPYHGLLKLA